MLLCLVVFFQKDCSKEGVREVPSHCARDSSAPARSNEHCGVDKVWTGNEGAVAPFLYPCIEVWLKERASQSIPCIWRSYA